MAKREKTEQSAEEITDYFDHLISSISPIATFDPLLKIKFVNSSFVKEFSDSANILGKNIHDVLALKTKERTEFNSNLEKTRNGLLVNSEFKKKQRVYGYTVFTFDTDAGIILKDISEKKKLESRIRKLHSEILRLQEKERQHLAAELHDGVGQTILAAKLNFISYKNDPEKFADKFQIGLDLIDRVSQELREIYTDLYPSLLKDLGLEAAIRSFLKSLFLPVNVRLQSEIQVPENLAHDLEVNLYRISQEIATNAAKHSGATDFSFLLGSTAKCVTLNVTDNGCGFDVTKHSNGFGLVNIKRRVDDLGGQVEIVSAVNNGCSITIKIPVKRIK